MKTKKAISLVLAVLLAVTVFSVTAAAEESPDAAFIVEAAGNSVTATDETINPEDILSGEVVPAEITAQNAEGGSEDGTLLTGGSDTNEDSFLLNEANGTLTENADGSSDVIPGGNPEGNPEGNPRDTNTDELKALYRKKMVR